MFALNISQDGKVYKAYFQEGRLRKYKNLPLARNASKQLLNNVKNNLRAVEIIHAEGNKEVVFRIIKDGDKVIESWETTNTGNNIDIQVTKKETPAVEVKKEQGTKVGNIASLDSLIEVKTPTVPDKDKQSKKELTPDVKDKLQFLIDCHEKHKKKAVPPQQVNLANSLNNLTDPKVTEKAQDFFNTFTANVLEVAIKDNDYKTLFNTEIMLAQKGYSWYPDENNHIQIAQTEKVLEIINKRNEP